MFEAHIMWDILFCCCCGEEKYEIYLYKNKRNGNIYGIYGMNGWHRAYIIFIHYTYIYDGVSLFAI